jgi:hypothetical protein
MDWTIEKSRFDSQQGKDISVFDSAHTICGATQLHMQCVPEDRSPGVKRPERETDRYPSSVQIKNA